MLILVYLSGRERYDTSTKACMVLDKADEVIEYYYFKQYFVQESCQFCTSVDRGLTTATYK